MFWKFDASCIVMSLFNGFMFKSSIDEFIIDVIWILLSNWFAVVCIRIGSMSASACVVGLRIFDMEKLLELLLLLLFVGIAKLFKFCCWFIIVKCVVDVDAVMAWIWFDICCCCCCCWWLKFPPAPSSSLKRLDESMPASEVLLTWTGWLCWPVVDISWPWWVMQRARQVVRRYERLNGFCLSELEYLSFFWREF